MMIALFILADSALSRILYFDPPYDKLLHVGVYGLMALLLKLSGVIRRPVIVWLVIVAVGLGDEFHQDFVWGRESSYVDFMADMIGATMGLLLLAALSKLPLGLVRVQD